MGELIIYSANCVSCRQRAKMAVLRAFAAREGLQLVTKRTTYDRGIHQEATERSSLATPYVWNSESGKSMTLGQVDTHTINQLL